MADIPKYYWDACAWIALIKREPSRFDSLDYLIGKARDNKIEIWTSTFTLAEVFKKACGEGPTGIDPEHDASFEDFLLQDFVHLVQVDTDIGVAARRLLRRFPEIRKPQDGIHAATALLNNVDELHTFDGCDLLVLDGKIPKRDGVSFLKICKPPKRPVPPDPNAGTLFEEDQLGDDNES